MIQDMATFGIDNYTILTRLVFSLIAGAVIGLEREAHKQPAGLKTHMLICLGSTLIMLLSIYIPFSFNTTQIGDPGRIAAQVITGVGFIGAGAIMRMGVNVRGLTTATSIWAIAAIGLAIGAGMYFAALISVVLILIVLIVVEQLENHFFTPLSVKILTIKSISGDSDEKAKEILYQNHFRILDTNPAYIKPDTFIFRYKLNAPSSAKWSMLTGKLHENDTKILEIEFSDPKI
jgi:putative Mg2+ transporter-C (MgtC) family protein